MAKRKVVFVLVEGPSDEAALDVLFNKIFDPEYSYVHVMHYDITTKEKIEPANIVSKIQKELSTYAKKENFKKSDFREIIHIVDTDGAFIADKNIISDEQALKAIYSLTDIRINNRQKIILRNKQKRANIDKLCATNHIWTIPYRVFYMSSNLDHVLHNKLNSSDSEKEDDAYNFAKKYENNIPEFISFITKSDFSQMSGYKESWNYIKKDLHSLERNTNLGICFQKN